GIAASGVGHALAGAFTVAAHEFALGVVDVFAAVALLQQTTAIALEATLGACIDAGFVLAGVRTGRNSAPVAVNAVLDRAIPALAVLCRARRAFTLVAGDRTRGLGGYPLSELGRARRNEPVAARFMRRALPSRICSSSSGGRARVSSGTSQPGGRARVSSGTSRPGLDASPSSTRAVAAAAAGISCLRLATPRRAGHQASK